MHIYLYFNMSTKKNNKLRIRLIYCTMLTITSIKKLNLCDDIEKHSYYIWFLFISKYILIELYKQINESFNTRIALPQTTTTTTVTTTHYPWKFNASRTHRCHCHHATHLQPLFEFLCARLVILYRFYALTFRKDYYIILYAVDGS